MRNLSRAKFSFVTRCLGPGKLTIASARRQPTQGDLVVARVDTLGQHNFLEDRHGRRVRLHAGNLVVGAYGNRYATDFYEGYVPASPHTHLLTAGGVIGTVASSTAGAASRRRWRSSEPWPTAREHPWSWPAWRAPCRPPRTRARPLWSWWGRG